MKGTIKNKAGKDVVETETGPGSSFRKQQKLGSLAVRFWALSQGGKKGITEYSSVTKDSY